MPAAGNIQVRPLVGGIKIAGPTADGTLGLVYKAGYFATAGHVVGGAGSFVGQPSPGVTVGMVKENFLSQGVDIALIKTVVGVQDTPNTVWVGQNARQPVVFVNNQLPSQGDQLWLQGFQTGTVNCSVYAEDVTINAFNETLENVGLLALNGQTQDGDSGSPVISVGTNRCYGIYGGRVQINGQWYGWFTPFDNLVWNLGDSDPVEEPHDEPETVSSSDAGGCGSVNEF